MRGNKLRASGKNMRYIKTLLISLLLSLSITANAASPTQYKIDVLIFSQLSQQGLLQEDWPAIKTPPIISSRAIYFDTPSNGITYHLLSNRYFSMNGIEKKLKNNPNYNVIMHFVWQQSKVNLARKKIFRIIGGQAYDNQGNPANVQLLSPKPSTINQYANWQVNGTISIFVNRYFNMGFNLQFAEPTQSLKNILPSWNNNNQNGDLSYFNFIQSRRFKSGELNYIDSPLFGVLVKTTPTN